MRFAYKAKTAGGEIKEGVLDAESRRVVVARLQRQNLFPISVREQAEGQGLNREISLRSLRRIRRSDVTTFTRQMSDLLKSGLVLVRALEVLEKQTENDKFKAVIAQIRADVAGGSTFSDALTKHPRIFGELYANMVRAGEVGGMLDAVMERLADFQEQELETRSKVIQAMAYPCIMVVIGIGVICVLLLFVLPKMSSMFADFNQSLPLLTQVLVFVSQWMRRIWWLVPIVVIGGAIAYRRYAGTPEGRLAIDQFKMRLPMLGDIIRKREIAKFARTLGTLLANGVSILKAMEIVEHTLSNRVLSTHVHAVTADIREGESLSARLAETGVFPPMVVNMVAVGEETGELEAALMRIAVSYETSTDRAIKTATTLLEPLFIVIMGIMVGMIAMAMILPILQLSSSLG